MPSQWFERRLAYTRSVAASSIGTEEEKEEDMNTGGRAGAGEDKYMC